MNDQEKRLHNRELVERCFDAIGNRDAAARYATYTDDVIIELAFTDPPRRTEGKENVRAHDEPLLDVFRFQLEITSMYDGDDPDTLVVEYKSDGTISTTGKPYQNSYISVVRFRDGLICFQREYHNPVLTQRALQPD